MRQPHCKARTNLGSRMSRFADYFVMSPPLGNCWLFAHVGPGHPIYIFSFLDTRQIRRKTDTFLFAPVSTVYWKIWRRNVIPRTFFFWIRSEKDYLPSHKTPADGFTDLQPFVGGLFIARIEDNGRPYGHNSYTFRVMQYLKWMSSRRLSSHNNPLTNPPW